MKLTTEIKLAIESCYTLKGYSVFGLRRMTGGIIAQVGDDVAPSFVWEDGIQTDEELGGTSAIHLPTDFGEVDADDFYYALNLVNAYEGQLVIIAGTHNLDAVHNDDNEIVLDDAIVVFVLD